MKTDRLVIDTKDFFSIDNGDEIILGDRRYEIFGHAKEMRFGIEDPKFWVKRAIDMETGEKKLIKFAFFESFDTTLAGVKIKCFRSPQKEADILELVKNHPHFMHGTVVKDSAGHSIRILDVVRGANLLVYLDSFKMKYDVYFQTVLPEILKKVVKTFEAIRFLHINGYKHGDIRNDHIIVENDTGNYVWIDFDYDFESLENPYSLDIFGLGNVLIYTIGKGFHNYYSIVNDKYTYGDLIDRIEPGDFSLLYKRRFINFKKIYPIIPKALNDIVLHFSTGAEVYYETVDEIIEDLNRCLYSLF
ncbi:MAG: protein kinase [Desulfobacterales bacterium]|nr:protein kinase [Desulfobacterales bacterium]MBF0395622.1 protein kinase [Desulfobacterales bacterium]